MNFLVHLKFLLLIGDAVTQYFSLCRQRLYCNRDIQYGKVIEPIWHKVRPYTPLLRKLSVQLLSLSLIKKRGQNEEAFNGISQFLHIILMRDKIKPTKPINSFGQI